jgi:hypothetical protein
MARKKVVPLMSHLLAIETSCYRNHFPVALLRGSARVVPMRRCTALVPPHADEGRCSGRVIFLPLQGGKLHLKPRRPALAAELRILLIARSPRGEAVPHD